MDTRKEKRLYGLKNVVILLDDEEYPAVIVDISPGGICLRCEKTLPTYREVSLRLEIEGQPVTLRASVRWVHDPIQLRGTHLRETGLSVLEPPPLYQKYLERIMSDG